MVSRTLRAGVVALASVVSLALVVFASGGAAPAAAQAALPAAPVSLVAPPACTCSEPVNVAGNQMQNCTCGALQCVVVGKAAATAPAMTCLK
ncbi:MAG: hypothetical protein ABW067_04745 [Rhizobacter sp.]